LTRGGAVR